MKWLKKLRDHSKLREFKKILEAKTKEELILVARELKLQNFRRLKKEGLISGILQRPVTELSRELKLTKWQRLSIR